LNFEKYEVYPVYITQEGEWRKGASLEGPAGRIEQLQLEQGGSAPNDISGFLPAVPEKGLDVILPLLHGPNGEDGTVQGMLEVMNLPYVGNGVLASSAGMDKVVMKQLFEIAGLKQTPYVYFIRREWKNSQAALVGKITAELSWPVFVKPANLGSSVGINKAETEEELIAAIDEALKFDRKIVVEQGVVAREIEIGVLGNDAPECSVAGEIKPLKAFYDYQAKSKDGNTSMIIPAELPDYVYAQLVASAKKAFKILACSGLVCADFFVTAGNDILINEVHTLPGFTAFQRVPVILGKRRVWRIRI